MGLRDALMRVLRRSKRSEETIESIEIDNQSSINQSIDIVPEVTPISEEIHGTPESTLWTAEKVPIVEKDSYHLGLAAGYTGKSIRSIEDSLSRIESQMVTKDWFSVTFEDNSPKIIEKLDKIDQNTAKIVENIEKILKSMEMTVFHAPEPLKTELYGHIQAIQNQLPLTPKQQMLIFVVKEVKEISYTNLANRLGITEDGLRGLLSITIRKANLASVMERFERNGKGWVRYKQDVQN